MDVIPTLVGYVLCGLALFHAYHDGLENRIQRLLMLVTLFVFGTLLEYIGVSSGTYRYPAEKIFNMGPVPASVSLAWVGIIYSLMIIGERLQLSWWLRILATTLIGLSLDWGMDPVAVHIGAWIWTHEGVYFGVPTFNFVGWFFIPISYLLAYGISWDRRRRRPVILEIRQIDSDPGLGKWGRLLYTLFLVLPLSLGLLMLTAGQLGDFQPLLDMSFNGLVVWAVFSVVAASGLVIWKRSNLVYRNGTDLIPPAILLFIGLNYTFFGLVTGRPELGFLMLVTGIPLWLIFGFTLRSKLWPGKAA